jgi:hypothetical protein
MVQLKLNMESAEYDEQVKIGIDGLLHRACHLTKSVLQQFDASVTRKANASNLSKLRLDSLEPCAEFLNIELADKHSNKIYTKSTLAPRIVSALFALLPSNCSQCNEDYCVEFECNDRPLLTCYKYYQGSQNCDTMKSIYAPLAELQLPTGFVWLCKCCTDELNPIVPRKSKSRHNIVSFQGDSKTNLLQDLTSSSPILENDKDELLHKLNNHESDSKSDICDKCKIGKCPHGYKGTKLVDNKPCPKSHHQSGNSMTF